MNSRVLSLCLAAGGGLALVLGLRAEEPQVQFPAPSPSCALKQRVGLTDVEISYSRPGVKDRVIFGGIVPYGELWRTGANASTKVSFSTPVKLEGHAVGAGTYAFYTIPGVDEWTIILSRETNLWGAYGYSQTNDLLRFKVAPVAFPHKIESFTIDINHIRDESAYLVLLWDETAVPIKLEVDVNTKVLPQIDAAMSSPEKKSAEFYFQAANYYFDHGQDLKKALGWLDAGLADKPSIAFELLFLKARILAKQGNKDAAIAAAKESIELGVKADGPNSSIVKMNQDLISSLQ